MSIHSLPTLEELARQALLGNEALTISVLEDLPSRLLPALFKDAFDGRSTRILKAMVAAWPFPCLPVGVLMKTFNLQIFRDLLDVLPTQSIYPRRGKLQEIDFRTVGDQFWTVWAGTEDEDCSAAETVSEKKEVKPYLPYELTRPLKVITDLYFKFQLNEGERKVLKWALQKKYTLQLCCVNLKIELLSLDHVSMILTVFEPEHIQVLELNIDWCWCALGYFSPYLTEMRNLHTLSLVKIHKTRFDLGHIPGLEKKCAEKFLSEFSTLSSLRHLSLNGISLTTDHMKCLLRNLQTPLETFSVTHCQLFQSHLNHLSQCESLHQLKHLDMCSVLLSDLCMKPLRVLLEKVANTLETLRLQGCGMTDSQLRVLLPALSQCSQLTKINFYFNDFSWSVLSELLQHTATLSKMTQEQYPIPRECYDEFGYFSTERFEQVCPVIMDTLRAISQPQRFSFAAFVCNSCFKHYVYDQETRVCSCWQ